MPKSNCLNCEFKSNATKNLSEVEIIELEKSCRIQSFKAGEIIVKQNSFSTSVPYVKSGLVKIHSNVNDKEKTIRIFKAPGYICLPSVFADKRNNFSASAIENSIICFLETNVFNKFVKENASFAYQIIMDLSKNELNSRISQIETNNKQSTGRIANILLYFADEIYQSLDYNLPITRQDIGDLVLATRESVSRTLADFQADKIIEIDKKKIRILNKELLKKISEKG